MFDILRYGLDIGEKLGAQAVEARYDDLQLRTLVKENQKMKETNINRRRGIGITVYYQGVSGFSYTAALDKKAVKSCAQNAFGIAKASSNIATIKLDYNEREKTTKVHDLKKSVQKHPKDFDLGYKMDLMNRAEVSAIPDADWVKSSRALYGELYGEKYFMNSDGDEISWEPLVVDLRVNVTASATSGDALVRGTNGVGGSIGLELYDRKENTPEIMGKQANEWANEQREAKAAPAGKFRALCDEILSGVLAHESFGHCTESDAVLTNSSVLKGKLNTKIGTDVVNIYDEGVTSDDQLGFYLPYDDEGTPTAKTVLVENGVLKNYLHNRGTAKAMNGELSGNARAIHYRFGPIPRMKNTYFGAGDLTTEEAIEQLKDGIYAIQTSGGQVNPAAGTFLFKAIRGYWVENGEIKYPIKDVTIKGELLALLNNVEGLTKELKIRSGYFGGCGKGQQFPLPTGLGSAKILFGEAMFGGEQQ